MTSINLNHAHGRNLLSHSLIAVEELPHAWLHIDPVREPYKRLAPHNSRQRVWVSLLVGQLVVPLVSTFQSLGNQPSGYKGLTVQLQPAQNWVHSYTVEKQPLT
jgi:hypothetical protein